MAQSKFEYVKLFEQHAALLPNTYIVVRVDGRGFHKLSAKYGFQKPNDRRALDLMNAAASSVIRELSDIFIAYGVSDEYSFVFERVSRLFDRRESKILTTVVSTFTSYFVHLWPTFFPDQPLTAPMPSFDGRVVLYPSDQNLRDYLNWRQADCHINNLYNTVFWALVNKGGVSNTEAEEQLKGTLAADKNEILFSKFQINYNKEPEMYRKGSIIYRDYIASQTKPQPEDAEDAPPAHPKSRSLPNNKRKGRQKTTITLQHTDLINDKFWIDRPWLLNGDRAA